QGAERVFPVAEIELARQFKTVNPDWLLVGERNARRLPDCDHGNCPSEIAQLDLTGSTVVHTTSAGTQGLCGAVDARVVLSAALVNATATVNYVRSLQPSQVTIVRMGQEARERSVEDDVCAEWLAAQLAGKPYDTAGIAARLRAAPSAEKFFDPACDWAPEADFAHCLALDRFGFALRLEGRETASPYLVARSAA
ncbi:MAG: 2-phosphosulfolactate phosphatase, partial [Pseudomonadota bacterium]